MAEGCGRFIPRELVLVIIKGGTKGDKAKSILDNAELDYIEVDACTSPAAPYFSRDFGPGLEIPFLLVDGNPISGLDGIQEFIDYANA